MNELGGGEKGGGGEKEKNYPEPFPYLLVGEEWNMQARNFKEKYLGCIGILHFTVKFFIILFNDCFI